MPAMKVENYDISGATSADTFTWPNNPQTFDDEMSTKADLVIDIPFSSVASWNTSGALAAREIVLQGHFDSANSADKRADYNELSKHVQQDKMKALYFASDRFYVVLGKSIKQTNSGGRTNFIDYVCKFGTIVNLMFGTTQRTSGTNQGTAPTFVEKISTTVSDPGVDVQISDSQGNAIKIPASEFSSAGDTITYYFVHLVDIGDGISNTVFNYVEVNGARIDTVTTETGNGYLTLEPAEGVADINITNTGTDTITFRDGYYG